jgi:hypothetical protein
MAWWTRICALPLAWTHNVAKLWFLAKVAIPLNLLLDPMSKTMTQPPKNLKHALPVPDEKEIGILPEASDPRVVPAGYTEQRDPAHPEAGPHARSPGERTYAGSTYGDWSPGNSRSEHSAEDHPGERFSGTHNGQGLSPSIFRGNPFDLQSVSQPPEGSSSAQAEQERAQDASEGAANVPGSSNLTASSSGSSSVKP